MKDHTATFEISVESKGKQEIIHAEIRNSSTGDVLTAIGCLAQKLAEAEPENNKIFISKDLPNTEAD